MPIWKLEPTAQVDDPHWKGYRYRRALLVEAEDNTQARLKATKWYKAEFQGDEDLMINQVYRSAFLDEKLYRTIRLTHDTAQEEQEKYPFVP